MILLILRLSPTWSECAKVELTDYIIKYLQLKFFPQEINNQNLAAAFQYFQAISKEDWEANKDWMLILKRLLSVK